MNELKFRPVAQGRPSEPGHKERGGRASVSCKALMDAALVTVKTNAAVQKGCVLPQHWYQRQHVSKVTPYSLPEIPLALYSSLNRHITTHITTYNIICRLPESV